MQKLLKGLEKFQKDYFRSHIKLFEELSNGQNPRILFITCSDSRIDPNLITQAKVGELFVIRNVGNIIPPYGAANGGEGAAIEYAISALNIEQIIVCGHSLCGAMKGLLKIETLAEKMPSVYDWLKHAEATRRVIKDNYRHFEGLELLELTVAENVLNQLDNLKTYPVIRSRLHQANLNLHGWIYRLETGEVLVYDNKSHDFVEPHCLLEATKPEYNLYQSCPLEIQSTFTINQSSIQSLNNDQNSQNGSSLSGYEHLSEEQSQRIYRGSGY